MKGDGRYQGRIETSGQRRKRSPYGQSDVRIRIYRVPQMNKLLAVSDGGMIPYPTLEQKQDIILNCVEVLHKLGVENPSVAVLAAVEKVNPKWWKLPTRLLWLR